MKPRKREPLELDAWELQDREHTEAITYEPDPGAAAENDHDHDQEPPTWEEHHEQP